MSSSSAPRSPRVVDGFKEETSRSRLDGREAVNIAVKKRSGANIISISKAVDKLIASNQQTWPGGTEITKVLDKAKDIEMMVAECSRLRYHPMMLRDLEVLNQIGFVVVVMVAVIMVFPPNNMNLPCC